MMLLDEDQISFSFASSMVDDNIEDYSHQIAEMIGLRNVSYLVQAGVSDISFVKSDTFYGSTYSI